MNHEIKMAINPVNLDVKSSEKIVDKSGPFEEKTLRKVGIYKEPGHKLHGKKLTLDATNYATDVRGNKTGTYWDPAKEGDTREYYVYLGEFSPENRFIDSAVLHIGPKKDLDEE